jgi:REP-associated tyrosine transposase
MTFHVVHRGNDRSRTFFVDDDYRAYLHLLSLKCQRYGTSVHAYVLMPNHVHLLLTSSLPDGISRTMQHVSAGYARRINDRYRRTGNLWEGRFRSSPIDSEFYCLACYRYIELNPLRAGMVQAPGDYRWSSYRENIGRRALSVVTPHPCYLELGGSPTARHERYREIVHEYLPDRTIAAIRHGASKGLPVGGDAFRTRIETEIGTALGSRDVGVRTGKAKRANRAESEPDPVAPGTFSPTRNLKGV